jgi:hypothetical protein
MCRNAKNKAKLVQIWLIAGIFFREDIFAIAQFTTSAST